MSEVKIEEIIKKHISLDTVETIKVIKDKAIISIDASKNDNDLENITNILKTEIEALSQISKATIVITSTKEADSLNKPKPKTHHSEIEKLKINGVKKIIAVASGKGGVGKSTTAVNIAAALSKLDLNVAIFDADIHGPSIPKMLGVENQRVESTDGQSLYPLTNHNIDSMSIGALIDKDEPIIWRGSRVCGAIEQLITTTLWEKIDVLVIDMPPGTGDVQLTISQRIELDGAVIVSTPQDIALLDARKGLKMFEKVNIPTLGIIENMSYFICPKCGEKSEIFGYGGAKETANELDTDFLGEVPLHYAIRKNADEGIPIVISNPNSDHSKCYLDIAKKIKKKLF